MSQWDMIPESSLNPTAPDPPAFISVKAQKVSRTILAAAKLISALIAGPLCWSAWHVPKVNYTFE